MRPRLRLVVASRNRAKAAEVERILRDGGLDFETLSLAELPGVELLPENGATFSANALAKAKHAAGATGLPAIADDSGLEVDALRGEPGIRSARYAGEDATDAERCQKLLEQMRDVPEHRRGARFRCAAAFATPEGGLLLAEGTCEGSVAPEPAGAAGFGYDPIFIPDGRSCTMAQLVPQQKDAISHRGRAFRRLARLIREHVER